MGDKRTENDTCSKVVAYLRVSNEEQEEGQVSLETQRQNIETY